MYKIFFLLFLSLNFFKGFSQPLDTAKVSVFYSFSHARDTMFLNKFNTENFVLQLGKNISVYKSIDQAAADSARNAVIEKARINFESTGQMNINMQGVKTATGNLIYKNTVNNTMVFVNPFMRINYFIEEAMPTINWVITEETKQVQTLTCQKATTKFRGRNYEAWFCPEFPYNSGPWKFNGLPGLIIEVYDSKEEVIFLLNKIEINKDQIVLINYPEKYQKTTAKEYTQLREGIKANPEAFLNGQMNTLSAGTTMSIKATTTMGRKTYNNPIELSKD